MHILLAIEAAAKTGVPQKITLPPRPRHPPPDMARLIPITTQRLLV